MAQVRPIGSTAPVGFFTNAPGSRNVPGCGSFNQVGEPMLRYQPNVLSIFIGEK